MSEVSTFPDLEFSRATPTLTSQKLTGQALSKLVRATRRRRKLQALVKVPMLDWPVDLFSGDNATTAELMSEDYLFEYDLPVASQGQQSQPFYVQAA